MKAIAKKMVLVIIGLLLVAGVGPAIGKQGLYLGPHSRIDSHRLA